MKIISHTPESLAAWCRERAVANARFDGRLTPAELRLIRSEWPAYFLAIASLLEGDAPTSGAAP